MRSDPRKTIFFEKFSRLEIQDLHVHYLSHLYEVIEIFQKENSIRIPEKNIAVLLKALLLHSSSWRDDAKNIFNNIYSKSKRDHKRVFSKFFGYGSPDIEKVKQCAKNRAIALGYGLIQKDKRHEMKFPLPEGLHNQRHLRKLTITLAWFSPVESNNRKYRSAELQFSNGDDNKRFPDRQNADWQQVGKWTLQHEIFEGENATQFIHENLLLIPISCKEGAGSLDQEVPYTMAVTLEVAEGVEIPIYEQVQTRIRQPIMGYS